MDSLGGDELVDLLLAGQLSPEEEAAITNDLLGEVFHGYPASNIRRLIHSENDQAVRAAAFVIAELGADDSVQLLDEVYFLLGHRSRNVRFDVLDAVLVAASPSHGDLLARAVLMADDPDAAVRWKATRLLANANREQLAAAIPYLDPHKAELVQWLVETGSHPESLRDIVARLDHEDKATRVFGVAAAARIEEVTRAGLERAAQSEDPDLRSFAEGELALLDVSVSMKSRIARRVETDTTE